MPSIPELVTFVTSQDPAVQAQWRELCQAVVYGDILAAVQDSLVVRVRERFRLQEMVVRCADYRRYAERRGQPARYELAGLCWALLLRYLYGWSLRTLEYHLRTTPLVQWCTGFGSGAPTPDHATLWRFEQWVRDHVGDGLFVTVLAQIDTDFPEERNTAFIGDTFGMRAAIADVSLTTLLRQCCERLWAAYVAADPAGPAACSGALDAAALWGAADEVPERLLPRAAAEERTLTTAVAAQAMLAQVTAHLPGGGGAEAAQAVRVTCVHTWCEILAKVLADEFTTRPLPPPKSAKPPGGAPPAGATPAPDHASGAGVAPPGTLCPAAPTAAAPLRRCTADERGSYRIISAVDPDATIRKHGDKITLGYNIGLLTSRNFVRAVRAFTGATPDSATVTPLLAQHAAQRGFTPRKYIYDRAAGTPKHIAEVARCSAGHTELIARQKQHPDRPGRFGPTAFTLTAAGLQCPNGCRTTRAVRSGSAAGWNYRFTHTQCAGCPLTAKCRDPAAKPTSHRTVFVSDYAFCHVTTLNYLTTAAAQADFAYRSHIEPIINALVNHNGARRARVRSLPKVQYQATCAALAYNLKRWHTCILAQEKAGQRQKPPCSTRRYPRP